jgi:ATP/maltotriose-dependent transcriptional regulator MalT/DNA-binding SARP family transcriptional activator
MVRTGARAAAQSVPRRRLLHRLEGPWKVAILSAPAGYGKSTLVRQWMLGRNGIWSSLGPDDRDTAHLLGSLIAAGLRRRPPIGRRSARLFGGRRDMERDGGLLTSSFLGELVPRSGTRFLVIENVQVLVEARESVTWLRNVMEESGPRVRIILTCRGPCPLPLARFDLQGGVLRLERDDLAFDEDERRLMLRRLQGSSPSSGGLAAIEEMIGGWPAGWSLLARSGVPQPRLERGADRAATDAPDLDVVRERVFGFLAEELLSPLSIDLQEALCKAALLEELDVEVLEAIMGRDTARRVLRESKRLDLLARETQGSGLSPRLHPLFQGFLRDRFSRGQPAKERRRVAGIAARRYARIGQISRAARVLRTAGDEESGIALVQRHLTGRKGGPLSSTLGPLAAEILRDEQYGDAVYHSAELLNAAAIHALTTGHPFDAVRWLAQSREHLLRERRYAMLPAVTQNEATAAHITGRIAETAAALDELLGIIPRAERRVRGLIMVQAANLRLYCGEPERARKTLVEAATLLTRRLTAIDSARMRECEANICFSEGRWERYVTITRSILPVYRTRGYHARVQAFLINLAEAHVYLGQEDEALRLLDEAEGLVSRTVLRDATVGIAIGRARAQMDMGELDAAERSMKEAAAGAERYGSRYYGAQIEIWQGVLERRRGRFPEAVAHFDQGMVRFGPTAIHWINLARMERALTRGLLRGRAIEESLGELHESRRASMRLGDAREAARNRLYEARLEQIRGGPFRPVLLQTLRAMRKLGCLVVLRKERDVSEPLLVAIGSELPATVRESVRPYGFLFKEELRSLPSRPSIIEIRLLGDCEIRVGGDRVHLPRRASLELIARLALRPGEPLAHELIAEAFWPGAGAAASRNRFDVALSAARRALEPGTGARGPFQVLKLEGGLCWLDPDRVRVDVAEFEHAASRCEKHVAALERARRQGGSRISRSFATSVIEALRGVAGLYRGELLPQFRYAEWTQTERERLRDHHTRILLAIGAASLSLGPPEESIAVAEEILGRDPCHEEAELLLLEALAATGDRRAVCRSYERFHRLIRRTLGFPPGPELTAVYRNAKESAQPGRPESGPTPARSLRITTSL